MMKRNSRSMWVAFTHLPRMLCLFLTLAFSVASVSVVAQSEFDFADPLEEIRTQIGQPEEAASTERTPADLAARAAAKAPEVEGPLTRIAKYLGLPVLGLVVLLALGLLAGMLAVMWFLGRPAPDKMNPVKDHDLYAVTKGSRGRRSLESGGQANRRNDHEEPDEIPDRMNPAPEDQAEEPAHSAGFSTEPTAATTAARVLSGESEQEWPEDELTDAVTYAAPETTRASDEPRRNDPSTWKRPNLDRLRDSIRSDWRGDEATATPDVSAQTADDETARAIAAASEKPITPPRSPAPRPAVPSKADAIRRIKALREAVKAG